MRACVRARCHGLEHLEFVGTSLFMCAMKLGMLQRLHARANMHMHACVLQQCGPCMHACLRVLHACVVGCHHVCLCPYLCACACLSLLCLCLCLCLWYRVWHLPTCVLPAAAFGALVQFCLLNPICDGHIKTANEWVSGRRPAFVVHNIYNPGIHACDIYIYTYMASCLSTMGIYR